ncbi:MAG: DUF6781 family protein [Planctomycetaceae bacterium]
MTNETQEAPKSDNAEAAQPVSEAVREAVESGNDVAERVRQIVVDLFRGKHGATATAREAIHGIVETASDIANRSAPEKADSVVRNVIDGIGTGLKSVAQTTQYAVQEATDRGQRFAKEDVERAKKDLNGIREILVDTVKYFADRVSTETGSTVKELKTHAERTMAAAKAVVSSSLEALAKHRIQTAGEAASTALRGSQLTAGALLSAVSGALAGAAELLDPARRMKTEEQTAANDSAETKS